jgi:BirA family transcriptional regulator, biotin operon repressor / biotin---[acetyl-CoA-carboxylase] ligase
MTSSDEDAGQRRLSLGDIDRILSNTFIQAVDYYETLPSTNTRAIELAADKRSEHRLPVLVITDVQTAGRGRGLNRWWSSQGSLTFSVLVGPETVRLAPKNWPQISLAAGLAVCDAVEQLVGGLQPALKWPNDVLVNGRKVCGILAEVAGGQPGSLVIGIGVNVSNRSTIAPPELQSSVVALEELSPHKVSRADVLVAILQRLDARVHWLASSPDALYGEWSRRCVLTGKNVEVEIHSRRIVGVCRGIDQDGALLLRTVHGDQRCLSGTILRYDFSPS